PATAVQKGADANAPLLSAPGPWQQRLSEVGHQMTGTDAQGNPILDPRTGKPIQPIANIHPAWWRTLAAGALGGFLGHTKFSGAAEPFASAILNTDPGMKRARALESEYQIA